MLVYRLGLAAFGASLCLAFSASAAASGGAVINEIFYHPPDDRDDLQFIEVHNPGSAPADLSGWAFTKGVQFQFPPGFALEASGFAVICRNPAAFVRHYGSEIKVAGAFTGKLSHSSDKLDLADAQNRVVDSVKYEDRGAWPIAPDGYHASLERINPAADGARPDNWASSRRSAARIGTPGRGNDSHSASLPPSLSQTAFAPARPKAGQPVTVSVTAADADRVERLTLLYSLPQPGVAALEKEVPMRRVSGDDKNGRYEAALEGQPEGRIVRFRIRAEDGAGAMRLDPSENEPRPTYSYYVGGATNTAAIPAGQVHQFGKMEKPGPSLYNRARAQAPTVPLGNAAFVYTEPGSDQAQLFDHVRTTSRKGGIKVRFHKDHLLKGMSTVNITFEGEPRWVLSEYLSYELYRRAGLAVPQAEHIRLSMNGKARGYFFLFEQPNKAFLSRNGKSENGNLYKLLWYGDDVISQHEKKNNPETGHEDLLEVIEGLNKTSGQKQWEFIEQHFNIEAMIGYYVVNMCISNWDGFFNNYFAYHDLKPGGKWELIPWDEDKTWGEFDGASPEYDWHSMPLTMGMNGDRSGQGRSRGGFQGPFGGPAWWRPAGYFSGPLLASPEFRQRFKARLAEFCATEFTPEKFGPVISALEQRLEPELKAAQQEEFSRHIRSFQRQLENRRKFILAELQKEKN